MAFRRVGNDFMDEEEYEVHAIGVWSFWVFIIAACLTNSYCPIINAKYYTYSPQNGGIPLIIFYQKHERESEW